MGRLFHWSMWVARPDSDGQGWEPGDDERKEGR